MIACALLLGPTSPSVRSRRLFFTQLFVLGEIFDQLITEYADDYYWPLSSLKPERVSFENLKDYCLFWLLLSFEEQYCVCIGNIQTCTLDWNVAIMLVKFFHEFIACEFAYNIYFSIADDKGLCSSTVWSSPPGPKRIMDVHHAGNFPPTITWATISSALSHGSDLENEPTRRLLDHIKTCVIIASQR